MASYSFDHRALGALLTSGAVAGVLLFFAGVLVGYHWSGARLAAAVPESGSGEAASPPPGSAQPGPQAAAPGQPQVLARRRIPGSPPRIGSQSELAELQSKVSTLKPRALEAGREAGREARRDAVEAAVAGAGEPAAAAPPPQERPEFALPPPPLPPPAFSLQVGAFLQPENLQRFVADLTERGYTPRIQEVTSSSGRTLSVVRVGGFEHHSEASQAALTFRQREGLDAFVRPEARS